MINYYNYMNRQPVFHQIIGNIDELISYMYDK